MFKERQNYSTNLMTAHTKSVLEAKLLAAESDLKQSMLNIGEAAGTESDWHDNAAFDYANIQYDVNSVHFAGIKRKLQNVEIITPRKKITDIDVGNTAIVIFQDEDEEETFTILGPDDSLINPGWLSFLSPLGNSLIGKSVGDTFEYSMDGDIVQKGKIIKILPGQF